MQTANTTNIKEALNEKAGFDIWWRLIRPHTLTASFIPVFVGTILSLIDGQINWLLFAAMLIASMLIQAATNMFNEYYDYKLGLDTDKSVGIGGTIVRDGVKPKTVRDLAFTFYGIALLLGIYICIASSWWIAVIGLICMAVGYLYTGGPFPISYTPFGELFSGVLMGTVIIAITYFIQTLSLTTEVILISIPLTIFIGSLNLANNIRDLDGDKIGGRKTIAVLIGREKAITLLAILFFIAYAITLGLIILNILPIWSVITFLSGAIAISVIKNFRGKTESLEMMPAMKATGKTNTIYGILLSISLVISMFF